MDQQIITVLKSLHEEIQTIKQQMVTKYDLKKFATKDDLLNLSVKIDITKNELLEEIKKLDVALTLSVDKNKVDRKEFDTLEKRVTKLEHN
jgi:hypothetical protein